MNKSFKYGIMISLVFSTQANLSELLRKYLGETNDAKITAYPLELQKLVLDTELDKRPFVLVLSRENADSTLLSSPTSTKQAPQDIVTSSVAMSKEFIWGGTFTLSGVWYDYDSTSKYKYYSQALTYSQDFGKNFLGRNTFLSEDVKRSQVKHQEKTLNSNKSKLALAFAADYLNLKSEVTLMELQKEALERAKKRLALVKRQVKDGLKEKVDLYSAESGLLAQVEILEQRRSSLLVAKSELEKKLESQINLDIIKPYLLKQSPFEKLPNGKVEANPDVVALKEKIIYLEGEAKIAKNNVLPKIELKGELNTNKYDQEFSKAFDEGTIGSENREKAISLNVTIPFGFYLEKTAEKSANLNKMKAQYDLKKSEIAASENAEQGKTKIKILEKNISSVLKRYELAIKTVEEFNKLYNRGRANFDQVIRAEEELISTEQYFVQYSVKREVELYSLYDVYGELLKKLGVE